MYVFDLPRIGGDKLRQIQVTTFGVRNDFLRVVELINGNEYGREAIIKLETLFDSPSALMNYAEAERMKKVLDTSLPIIEAEEKRLHEIRRNLESICIAVGMQAARR